jgi:hypothetical protein
LKKGITTIFIVIVAMTLGISLSQKPWRVYEQQKAATQQRLHDLNELEHEHILDLQKEAKVGSSLGQEELARGQGWHKKGELPVGG